MPPSKQNNTPLLWDQATGKQIDLEFNQLIYRGIFTFIASFIVGFITVAALVLFQLIFAAYNIGSVLNPVTIVFIVYVFYITQLLFSQYLGFGDVPSVQTLVHNVLFVLYRAPTSDVNVGFFVRVKAIVLNFVLTCLIVFGVTLGIEIFTLRGGTSLDSVTNNSNIGQPRLDNFLLDRSSTLFMIAAVQFALGMLTATGYLGTDPEHQYWPASDAQKFADIAPLKAAAQAAYAILTIPLMGGFITYEWILATAMVSRSAGDLWLYVGMMITGDLLCMLVCWVGYAVPVVRKIFDNIEDLTSDLRDEMQTK